MIKNFVYSLDSSSTSITLTPGNGYLWKLLKIYITLTGVSTTATQSLYISIPNFTEVLAYIPAQTAAGTYQGMGTYGSKVTEGTLVTWYGPEVITYQDGIEISPTLPSGATATVNIILAEEPEESACWA